MNDLPKPILGMSDSDIMIDSSNSHFDDDVYKTKIIKQTDSIFIPDFSERVQESASPKNTEQQFYCISTRQNNSLSKQTNGKSETIDNIIKRLDVKPTDTTNDENEYVTKAKFSTLIGDMRVDILALINLLSTLNKNLSNESEEIQNLKKDMIKLVTENSSLRERLNKLKEDGDTRYNNTCQQYDKKIEELNSRLNKCEKYTTLNVTDSNTKNIRVVKKTQQYVSEDSYSENESKNESKNESINHELNRNEQPRSVSNSITDSNMEQKLSKFKTTPARSRSGAIDKFGANEEDIQQPIITNATRQVNRSDAVENQVKITTNTKQSRANRLGLNTIHSEKK